MKFWKNVYEKWDKPFLVAFGGEEKITIRMKDDFINRIPNPTVITLGGAGHFVQEEVQPETNVVDLYGREYKFGVRDCFEAVRDYLLKQGLEIPHRALFEDNWYKKGLDYFTTEMAKTTMFPRGF